MTVNDEALGRIRSAQALTRRVQDEHTRDLVAAWVTAWDDLQPQFTDALETVMAGAQDGRVTRAQMSKATRLAKALEAAHTQLSILTVENQRLAVEPLPEAIAAVVEANAAAIASQLPAASAGAVVTWNRMAPDALAAIVTRTTQQIEAAHLALPDDVVRVMRSELIRGVAVGDNPRATASRMVRQTEKRFNGGLSRALTIARTETMDAHRFASQASNEANTDVLKGWVWVAALDRRTCIACAVMHGTEHKVTEPGPAGHQNCRCTSAPVTKTWAELGIPGLDDDPPALEDPQAWFDNLTPASQLDVMGSPARLHAYQDGSITWGQLATTRHTPGWRDSVVPTPVKALG